ncbi:hypothetical protein D3M75_05090 [Aliarcobacter butzleri]|nr:hypothetical protein D3M75_05090 [Aliarcobacter butzleri]
MTEIELNKKLINFGMYRITNNKNIDLLKDYDLFCFIINDNIYETGHIKLNKKNIKSFTESSSLYEYINKKILVKYHYLDKKSFKSYIYCVPKEHKTKNIHATLLNMILENEIQSSFSYLKFLKDKKLDYSKIGTLFLLIYMSMSYMILSNSGFNIKNLDSLNIIISIIFFQVSSIISIFPTSFIIGLFKTPNIYVIVLILFIIYQIIKRFNIYYFFSFIIYFLKHSVILIMKIFITLSISIGFLYIIYSPLSFSFDNFKFHTKFKDYSNDNEIFKMYLDKTGYPKILYKDEINNTNKNIFW